MHMQPPKLSPFRYLRHPVPVLSPHLTWVIFRVCISDYSIYVWQILHFHGFIFLDERFHFSVSVWKLHFNYLLVSNAASDLSWSRHLYHRPVVSDTYQDHVERTTVCNDTCIESLKNGCVTTTVTSYTYSAVAGIFHVQSWTDQSYHTRTLSLELRAGRPENIESQNSKKLLLHLLGLYSVKCFTTF